MTRPSLTLTLIVKNEIKNIERLATSIEGCFDEVILVDTGSTDGTIEKAKELGFHVEHFTWVNDFSAARNYAKSFVKTDYWMWLDLDDSLQDKEHFIRWRDEVMLLGDVWLANYHYTVDKNSNPLCLFLRERVVKTSLDMKWTYPIHEGLIPPPGSNCQMTNAWYVRHHRTEEDLKTDKGRNLKIFEAMIKSGEKLEPRMQYYYGKELFEAKRPVEAQEHLLKALSANDIEVHDRILAIQYGCYALMGCGQTEKALSIALQGLAFAPKRAELFCIIADCYIKLNKLEEALPYLSAAENCTINTGPSVIFSDHASYNVWPKNQKIKIAYQMQKFDEAETIALQTIESHPNDETSAMLTEIQKAKYYVSAFKTAKPCDDIVITCTPNTPYLWDSKLYKERSMGGSETAAIEMAKWLTRLSGKKVIVFNHRESTYIDEDQVEYRSTNEINDYMAKNKPFAHIAWRHNFKCTDALTYLWCHDLYTPGGEVTSHYEKMLCLTPFHKNYVQSMQGVPSDKILVTRNGIVSDRFKDGPWEKDEWKFVFGSSPDRGLDRTMLVLDKVRERFPQIKLHIFYGIEHLPQYNLKALHDHLKAMMEERKDWVTYHGATEQGELLKQYKSAAFCVQPSDFIETSKITAIEMLLCGVYQITRGVGGCVDTLKEAEERGMCKMLYSDCKTPEQFKLYEDAVIQAIEEQAYKKIVDLNPDKYSWESVAKEWLAEFSKTL